MQNFFAEPKKNGATNYYFICLAFFGDDVMRSDYSCAPNVHTFMNTYLYALEQIVPIGFACRWHAIWQNQTI